MDISLYGLAIAVFIFLIWFWNSLYVIKEWERGVVLRLGRMQPDAKGAGLRIVFWPIETLYRISLRIETLDVPSGHHHARQRFREGERGGVFPRGGCESGAFPGAELFVRDVAESANHAAQHRRTIRAGRDPRRARKGKQQTANHS